MKDLYILPFDHRGSFMKIIGAASTPTESDVKKARDFKRIIYEGFLQSVKNGVPKEKAGILVDEWLGKDLLKEAKSKGFMTCTPLELSGQDEFEFDRADWQKQIEELSPTYTKVLVRYNPEGNKEANMRQSVRLAGLSRYLALQKRRFLFELLVPATEAQLKKVKTPEEYDLKIRPDLMVSAIKQLYAAGVKPEIWKLEGLDTTSEMEKVGRAVVEGNPQAGIIILGRGESAEKAEQWLKNGAAVSCAVGFAVGRTIFKGPLEEFAAGKINKNDAVKKISDNFSFFVKVWETARHGS